MAKHFLCPASEITTDHHKVFQIGRHNFGVFIVEGKYHGIRNNCPHQGGPLCEGAGVFDEISAEVTDDRKVREFVKSEKSLVACPWHGFEFDIRTGQCMVRQDWKVKTYDIYKDDKNDLYVELPD